MEFFVIGESEIVTGFALVGVQGKVAVNRTDALEVFNRMTGQSSVVSGIITQDKPKVLILTEEVALMLEKEVYDWQMKAAAPLIVEIPGLHGHVSGRKSLSDAIKEAVGVQI